MSDSRAGHENDPKEIEEPETAPSTASAGGDVPSQTAPPPTKSLSPVLAAVHAPSRPARSQGGQGAAQERRPFLPVAPHRLLRRMSHLLALTALLAVPLIYPLHIHEELDYRITERVLRGDNNFLRAAWIEQFQPAFFSGWSPLLLKRYVWALLALALAVTHISWKLMPGRSGSGGGRLDAPGARRWTLENALLIAFAAWAGMSVLLWLPPIEGTGRAGAGFLKGLDAWSDLLIGLGYLLMVSDLLRRRRWVYKGAGLLIAGGGIVAVLAIGQRLGWTGAFLTRWAPEDIRNRMSSLIGHNTGLSSFLIPAVLLSLALGVTRWREMRWPAAALVGLYWLLLGMTLIMAQSRAVILILFAAVPALFWILHRTTGLSPGRTGWLMLAGGAVLILAAQIIPAKWNPFYDHASPLTRRVHDLSLERLKAETRLRILLCSVPVIARSPVLGSGFGSFQYVYPDAQGWYFANHPSTILVPTGKRTERAHDEYLQILMETGLAGFALGLAALAALFWRGWRAFQRTLRPADIPIQAAIAVSIAALLVHAAVDFPFRVPPIAIALVWMLAVWQAGEHIWLPGKSADSRGDGESAGSPASAQLPGARLPRPANWIAWGVGVCAALALAIAASGWFSTRMVSSNLTERAHRILQTYLEYQTTLGAEKRIGLLGKAEDDLRRALSLRPADGEVHFVKAYINFCQGREAYLQASHASEAGIKDQAALWRTQALSRASAGISSLNLSLQEVRYHQSFHIRGNLERLRALLTGSQADRVSARTDMERAVAMSPAYQEGIVDLIALLEMWFPQETKERRELLELLYKWNRPVFFDAFVFQGGQAISEERYADAAKIYRDLVEAAPNDAELLGALAFAYLQSGEFDRADEVLTELSRLSPRPIEYNVVSAGIALKRKEWQRALVNVEQALRHPAGDRDIYRILRYLILEKLGETQKAREGLKAMERRARSNPHVYVDLAMALADRFDDLPRAAPYLEQYLAAIEKPADPKIYWYLAKYYLDVKHDTKQAARFVEKALAVDPRHAPSLELKQRIEKSPQPAAAPTAAPTPSAPSASSTPSPPNP